MNSSAPRCDGIFGPHAKAQALSHGAQQLVSAIMANSVVHHLEAVEVQENYADVLLYKGRMLDGLLESIAQQDAVRQAGE